MFGIMTKTFVHIYVENLLKVLKTKVFNIRFRQSKLPTATLPDKIRLTFAPESHILKKKEMDKMLEYYFVSKDGKYHLSENFVVKEFQCKDGSDLVLIDTRLVEVLQMIREHYNKPVIINSAYRTPGWNAKVGGAKYSYHQVGMAADIQVKGISSKDVAKVASGIMTLGGVISYTNFVHVDVRKLERYRKGVE